MATSGESKLDEFKPYLHQRWNEGVTDAAALHAGLRERGWAGSMDMVPFTCAARQHRRRALRRSPGHRQR